MKKKKKKNLQSYQTKEWIQFRLQTGSKPEPQSPNSEEVDGKLDSGKRKRLNEEIKRENEVLFFNVSRGEGERESGEVKERDL